MIDKRVYFAGAYSWIVVDGVNIGVSEVLTRVLVTDRGWTLTRGAPNEGPDDRY